jgi:hypothetical protein
MNACMNHDEGMKRRLQVILSILTLAGAACGGSDASDTSEASTPQITLLTTTTAVPEIPVDSGSATTDDASNNTDDAATPATSEPVETPAASDPTVATTTAAPTTTTVDLESRFSLTTSGLGSTSFGADPDGAIAYINALLGQPTADTGWVDPFTVGPCGGTELRQVTWGNLQLEFGDASNVAQGRRHFYSYTYGQEGSATAVPSGLATPENITVGSTVGALIAAYPNTQFLSADEFSPDSFVVNDDLRGRLSGLTDADVVELIVGGLPCEG